MTAHTACVAQQLQSSILQNEALHLQGIAISSDLTAPIEMPMSFRKRMRIEMQSMFKRLQGSIGIKLARIKDTISKWQSPLSISGALNTVKQPVVAFESKQEEAVPHHLMSATESEMNSIHQLGETSIMEMKIDVSSFKEHFPVSLDDRSDSQSVASTDSINLKKDFRWECVLKDLDEKQENPKDVSLVLNQRDLKSQLSISQNDPSETHSVFPTESNDSVDKNLRKSFYWDCARNTRQISEDDSMDEDAMELMKALTVTQLQELRSNDIRALVNGSYPLRTSFKDKYIVGDSIGDGGFGFVMTAVQRSTKKLVAVKFIAKALMKRVVQSDDMDYKTFEVQALKQLNHRNIIGFIEFFCESVYVILVTELHGISQNTKSAKPKQRTSCDLFEFIETPKNYNMSESTIARIFAQIVSGVDYMHSSCNIVHRDLKDENIVIDSKHNVKIIDLYVFLNNSGSAAYIPNEACDFFTTFRGTPLYASPEVADNQPHRGPEAEVWALGVLLHVLMYRDMPFSTTKDILRGNRTKQTKKVSEGTSLF